MKKKMVFILAILGSGLFAHSILAQCDQATAQINLQANNVKARLLNGGDLWWDLIDGSYQVGTDSVNLPTLFHGNSLWMAGIDELGQRKVAAMTYRQNNSNDYFPGPLAPNAGTITTDNCLNWDRFFVIDRGEVDQHLQDLSDNGNIDGPVPQNILGWPATGNPHFLDIHGFDLPSTGQELADFIDQNQNGLYEPMDGDYPKIRGDQTIWWVFNDAGGFHTASGGDPLGMEVQVTAWAESSNQPFLDNTTFYSFKFINRSGLALDSLYLGWWADPDLGCPGDDYVGCDPPRNLVYSYNGDSLDELDCGVPLFPDFQGFGDTIPGTGICFLEGPVSTDGEELGLSHFIHYSNSPNFPSDSLTSLVQPRQIHDFMRGIWATGTPVSQGGNGYDPGNTTPYPYTYDESLVDGVPWTECNTDQPAGDRRFVASFGPLEMSAGSVQTITYATLYVPSMDYPCPDLNPLKIIADSVQNYYDNNLVVDAPVVRQIQREVKLWPNPATNYFSLYAPGKLTSIQVYGMDGRLIDYLSVENGVPESSVISVTNWSRGVYFLEVKYADGDRSVHKLVVQ